ncbi:BED-type domain-containing protein [Citrus sinensis]|uniref:BED-type domain-containing protein n=1 Tax=Citrus sinensis TaxID=2711 RepID=A0ACB8JPU1_CITSI|nr:BED-type domain-containing protein [Citrus sinensis]
MIIIGELPLSFVDNKGFRHFCSVAIPQFVMPSRRTIGRDVMELFLEEKAMLKSLICNNKQRVSLTTDLWTSVQNMSYMVITAHFIISFSAIEDHRGKSIGLGELHASVTAIRNAMKYVRSSSMRLRTFKQCAEQVNCPKGIVVLDCPTRWNSTYLMLMTALKFQAAFDRMAEVDKPYEAYFAEQENNVRRVSPPGPDDCESAERIVKFLKVFYDATLLLIVASILDPLAKMDFAKHIFEIIFGNDSLIVEQMTKAMKDLLNEFYDAYSAFSASSTPSMYGESGLSGTYGGTSSSQRFTTETNLVDVAGGECDDAFQVARPFLGYARKVSVQNESKRVVYEVERYLKDPVEDPSNLKLNVLLWWRVNGSRYPILEKITRDVLVVPVSTVASESAFSTGHRIIDEYRSSLTSAMVEALICTENWLQSKLFANLIYNLQEDQGAKVSYGITRRAYKIASFDSGSGERQHWCYRSQASTVEAVSANIGVMDV